MSSKPKSKKLESSQQQQQSPINLPKDTFTKDWRIFQLPELTPPDNSQFLEQIQERFETPLLLQQVRSV